MSARTKSLGELAEDIRKSTFSTIYHAGSGHLGACSSSAELMTALYFGGVMNYDPNNPQSPTRDRVYVRGHVGPLRYKIFSLLNWIEEKELQQYRRIGSRLKGHESMHHMPGVDMTPSGSLGMLLSYAAGAGIATKDQGLMSKHIVFLGDGEEQEGNVSEAARHIARLDLDNVICILDNNKKQLSRPIEDVDGRSNVSKIWNGYGWEIREIKDGHDIDEILDAYEWAFNGDHPRFLLANTVKGKGLEGCEEHYSGFHTIGACKNKETILKEFVDYEPKIDFNEFRREHSLNSQLRSQSQNPIDLQNKEHSIEVKINSETSDSFDSAQIQYLKGFSEMNKALNIPFYFITPDLIGKNVVEKFGLDKMSRYLDVGIREQHAIALAHGISQTNPNARIMLNCFDAFLLRSSDQLNAAAQGKSKFILLSDVAGLTQGKNGSSHQSTCQPAVPLMMSGVEFFEPGDVQDMFNVLNYSLSKNPGIVYVRLPKIRTNHLSVENANRTLDYYLVKETKNPNITLVGSSFVTGNLLEAAERLEQEGIRSRLINVVSPKRLGPGFVNLVENNKPLLVAYNGNPSVLQSAVSESILRVNSARPSYIRGHGFIDGDTGSVEELLEAYKLDPKGLEEIIRGALNG